MALAHTPGLGTSWRSFLTDGSDLDSAIVLLAAMVFFALKVHDLPLLRFRPGRRTWVAIGVAVAFLHVDLFTPGDHVAILPECTGLVAGALLLASLDPTRRVLRTLATHSHPSSTSPASLCPSHDTVWFDAFRPRCWLLASRLFSLRAPPA